MLTSTVMVKGRACRIWKGVGRTSMGASMTAAGGTEPSRLVNGQLRFTGTAQNRELLSLLTILAAMIDA